MTERVVADCELVTGVELIAEAEAVADTSGRRHVTSGLLSISLI